MKTRKRIITALYLCAVIFVSSIPTVPMTAHAQASQEEIDAAMRLVNAIKAAQEATDGTEEEKMEAARQAWDTVHAEAQADRSGWYYDLDAAKEIFALVNAERAAAGIPELIWDDTAYAIAMQRCYEADNHDSMRAKTSENAWKGGSTGNITMAAEIHQGWHDSQGHYDNYMNTKYNHGAVAVLRFNNGITDICIPYEVFFRTGQTYSTDLWMPCTNNEYGVPFQVTNAFDPVYYAQTYPDVAGIIGTDTEALQNHYLTSGKSEGRFPNALAAYAATVANVTNATNVTNAANGQYEFDPVFYAQTYPDVAAAFGMDAEALYNHYITCGINEGRLPNANAANGQ
ncbi:MAG: CAP domain-containing protein [Lachnospiraceae bacterium]|nr:CAP domain-containing protein [Lachnospiraceae bacterium]